MNPVPGSVKATALPQVNLIPPEVNERKVRGRQRLLALAVLAVVLIVLAAITVLGLFARQDAEQELADAEQRNVELTAEAAKYSEVNDVEAQLNNSLSSLSYAGATEISYRKVLDALDASLPVGITLDTMTLNKVQLQSAANPETGPFAIADIGEITFTAHAAQAVDAEQIALTLEQIPFFQHVRITAIVRAVESSSGGNPEVPGSASGDIYYSITGKVRITYDALTLRFAPEGADEFVEGGSQLLAGEDEPTASEDPSPSPSPEEGA